MVTYDQTEWKALRRKSLYHAIFMSNKCIKIRQKSFEKKTKTKRRKIQEEKLCV